MKHQPGASRSGYDILQIKLKHIQKTPPPLFTLLGEPIRWQLVQTLAESDRTIQELSEQVGQPLNLLSYHLRLLREVHLVNQRRSSLDGRATYCSLDGMRLNELYEGASQALFAFRVRRAATTQRPVRVLFLCTHNAARSQLAEGLLREAVQGHWLVASAGSDPRGVHPLAIATLAQRGVDIQSQSSKDVNALEAREYDFVITLCDRVRAEKISWPNRPRRAHWSLPDPLAVPQREQPKAFRDTADALTRRIRWFLQLDVQSTDPSQSQEAS